MLKVETNELIREAIRSNMEYVCSEVLANDIQFEAVSNAALITDLEAEADTKIDLLRN